MLFNSLAFLGVFFPLVLAAFHIARAVRVKAALPMPLAGSFLHRS